MGPQFSPYKSWASIWSTVQPTVQLLLSHPSPPVLSPPRPPPYSSQCRRRGRPAALVWGGDGTGRRPNGGDVRAAVASASVGARATAAAAAARRRACDGGRRRTGRAGLRRRRGDANLVFDEMPTRNVVTWS